MREGECEGERAGKKWNAEGLRAHNNDGQQHMHTVAVTALTRQPENDSERRGKQFMGKAGSSTASRRGAHRERNTVSIFQ